MNPYYPIFLNINGRKCVVIGGGQVALRKVKALLEHGADIWVISPDICPELSDLANSNKLQVSRRDYRTGDLEGSFIALVATSDHDINNKVSEEAKEKKVLVNAVDDPDISDFIVPSNVCRGDVNIAISTGGKSPALARKIRTRLEEDFDDEYASLALLIEEVRTEVKRQGIEVNGDDWQKAIDLDVMIDLLKQGKGEKAKAVLLNNLKSSQK
jgi:siroheme synthase-like protein